jgi:protein-disulfide isomerase
MQKNSLGIPIAIVIAAAIIGGAIYMTGRDGASAPQAATGQEATDTAMTVAPVTSSDHIRGNPNAPIMLVEYSDYDCPFCKQFHETMKQIMAEYGQGGQVAWVYRNFPLQQLHPNAPKLAAAAECVAELGGNDAFWTFTDEVFEGRGTNESTDLTKLPEFAEKAGVDKDKFQVCFNSGKYDDKIQADYQAAIAAGGNGTPYTVVLVGDQKGSISGAQSYSTVKQIVDGLLSQINGQSS